MNRWLKSITNSEPTACLRLCTLLHSELRDGVGNLDVQLVGTLNDHLSGLGRNVVGNLSTVLSVVHHKHFKLLRVVDEELVETVGKKVSGVLVGTVTNGRLRDGAFKSPSHSGVNTL